MDTLEKLSLYFENTPEKQILADIKHAQRYDDLNEENILIEDLVTEWALSHHYPYRNIDFDEKIEFDKMESFSSLLSNKPLKNSEVFLYL